MGRAHTVTHYAGYLDKANKTRYDHNLHFMQNPQSGRLGGWERFTENQVFENQQRSNQERFDY